MREEPAKQEFKNQKQVEEGAYPHKPSILNIYRVGDGVAQTLFFIEHP